MTLFAFIEIQIPLSPRGWRGVWNLDPPPIGEWEQWNPALRTSVHNEQFRLPRQKDRYPVLQTLVTCALSIYVVTLVLIVDIVLSQSDDRFLSVHLILLLKAAAK